MSIPKQLKLNEIDATHFLCKSALYLFLISDIANKILFILHYDFYRVSIFTRSIYELLFFAIIILFINPTRLLFLKIFAISFFLFLTGQLLIYFRTDPASDIMGNIVTFNKYFFVFIIYFTLYKLQDHSEKFGRLTDLLANLFLLNSIATIIGFIFRIPILRTYTEATYRYGYSGFIPAQNEATLFFVLAISYFYYRQFFLHQRSYKFLIVILSGLVLGTKAIYLFLLMLLIFHFLNFSNLKAKIISLSLILTSSIGGFFYFQTQHAQALLEYFISRKDKMGWFTMLFSGRDSFVLNKGPEIMDKWNIINYFVGGQDQARIAIEMDFFDLFFFLGAIGGSIYLVLYFSTLFKFNIMRPFNLFFVFSYFALAFLGGHFFLSAVNALYLCLISMYIYVSQRGSVHT